MIPLSSTARSQFEELVRYYAERDRDLAIDNLADCTERASARFLANDGLFYDAPRPYPTLPKPGWRRTREGRYWVAFGRAKDGPVIRAIFHDTSDIEGRL